MVRNAFGVYLPYNSPLDDAAMGQKVLVKNPLAVGGTSLLLREKWRDLLYFFESLR
jgi:hypothetical protein